MKDELKKTSVLSEDELENVSGGRGLITLEVNPMTQAGKFDTLEEKMIDGKRKRGRARITTLENNSSDPKPGVAKL